MLKRVQNISDLRRAAQKRLPRMIFDYIDGGADDEITLAGNAAAFRNLTFNPDILVNVSNVDLNTSVLGEPVAAPLIIAPTASSRLFHPRAGERAVAAAAGKAGLAYGVSSVASVSFEEIAARATGPKWLQLYVWRDRELVRDIMARAKTAGYTALILTADMPVAGNRERDHANDFTLPPKITYRTVSQMLARPGYLMDMALSPAIRPANLNFGKDAKGIIQMVNEQVDRSLDWRYAEWLRGEWGGPFAIKGIAHAEDAKRALAVGADGIWISNHGGRQLDTAPATLSVLPEIADALQGDAEIILDGGVRRGSDILKAVALGAKAVAVGRPYLFGLAAAGEAGVARAIEILLSELERTMALTGRTSIAAIDRSVLR